MTWSSDVVGAAFRVMGRRSAAQGVFARGTGAQVLPFARRGARAHLRELATVVVSLNLSM